MATRPTHRLRSILLTCALIAGLTATGATTVQAADPATSAVETAAKAPKPKAPKPNLWLQLHAGPNSELTGATVTVTNRAGKVVGKGKANNAGTIMLKVTPGASSKNPYLVRTSGGKVRGKAFDGHLELIVTKLGMRQGAQFVDLVTTIASEYVERYGGSLPKVEGRVFTKLGIASSGDHGYLASPSYDVHAPHLTRHHRTKGGFDGTVRHLVGLLKQGKPFPSFATSEVEDPNAFSSSGTAPRSSSSNAACQAQTLPNPNANSPATIGVYGGMMIAGLVSGFVTKDPSLLLNGAAGMVFANEPGMTNASMLVSIQAQLSCISQQIKLVQETLSHISLQISVANAASCQENWVTPTWDNFYQPVINAAAKYPDDPAYSLDDTVNNSSLQPMIDQIKAMDSNCGDAINDGLFSTEGGVEAAWPTVLSQYRNGDFNPTDTAAFTPGSLSQLQQFLQYWGNIMYQQTVMMNDYYNFQATVVGKPQTTLQNAAWGGNCQKAPSLDDVAENQGTSSWCQWQQNIVDVWPGNLYSDEVADWDLKSVASSSPYALSGSAVSAVPGGWGKSTTAWDEAPGALTPAALGTSDLPNGTWKVSNALATYNGQPQRTLTAPYQRYDYSAAQKTFAPSKDELSGYYDLRQFFIGQLNATITDDTATPCTENCDPWTLVAADGKTELEPYPASDGPSCYDIYLPMPPSYAYQKRYVHNAVYSPKPWSTDTSGGYIGGETSSKNNNGSKVCSNEVPPFAWFLARPWTQGATWPVAPTITSPSTVPANALLTASGCPDSGCTWAITSGAISGLTISSSGQLDYTGTSTSKTANITVAAMNTYQVSLEQAITVNLTEFLPVVTSSGNLPRNAQLAADHCPTSDCTWSLTGTVPAGVSLSSTGLVSYTGTTGGVVAIRPVATNSVGASQPGYVQIDLDSEAPSVVNPGVYARNGLLIATGGSITWRLISTTVPQVNVNSLGNVVVSGTPSASTAKIVVTATNQYGLTSPPTTLTVDTKTYAPIITSKGTISYGNGAKLTASGCPSGGCSWSFFGYTQTGQAVPWPPNDVVLYADGTLKYTGSGGVPTVKVVVITSMSFPNGAVSVPVELTLTL